MSKDGSFTDLFEGAIEDIYYRFDTMISNSIDYEEFKDFFDTVGETITQQEFDADVLTKFCSTGRGLTLKGFKQWFKEEVPKRTEEKVFEWLSKLGYDKELFSSFSRSFIVTFHSEHPLSLQVGDTVGTNLEEAAQKIILRERGNVLENKAEACLLYTSKE